MSIVGLLKGEICAWAAGWILWNLDEGSKFKFCLSLIQYQQGCIFLLRLMDVTSPLQAL